ncbi:MAG: DnaJ domain-containing protein [Ketobacter sp.]|nr:DnaJ domain-containing protein [Ketobacter sp.]
MRSHYQTLNVDVDAPVSEIKKSYKDLAKKHHPDTGGNVDRFQELAHAWNILKDENSRSHYDKFGEDPAQYPPNAALSLVAGLLNQMMDDPQIEDINLIKEGIKVINLKMENMQQKLDEIECKILSAEKIRKRVGRNGEKILPIINSRIDNLRKSRDDMKRLKEYHHAALEIISGVDYEMPLIFNPRSSFFDMTSATT